jgi:hypothetical protein
MNYLTTMIMDHKQIMTPLSKIYKNTKNKNTKNKNAKNKNTKKKKNIICV